MFMSKGGIEIKTAIPGPRSEELQKRRQAVVPRGAASATPIVVEKGQGAIIEDVDGNRYLDFAGGIGVLAVGYSHPTVVAAVKDQAEKMFHTCSAVNMYEPYVVLAEKLAAMVPGDYPKKTVFLNSGAEAVENAVKIARSYSKRPAIVVFENAFHGRTLLTMSMTAKIIPYKSNFGPFAPEIYRLPYPYCYRCPFGLEYGSCNMRCLEYIEESFNTHIAPEDVAALVIETVVGEGGFLVPPKEFLPGLRKICEKYNILYVADEIQCGYGRTGKMFAYEHYDIVPDMVTTAKSLAAGMPLSAVIGKADVMDTTVIGGLGGTYSGNPVALAAGNAVLDVFAEEKLMEKSDALGEMMMKRFKEMQEKYPIIGDVRGLGAMVAIELVEDRQSKKPAADATKKIMKYCYERGLILVKAGMYDNVVRMLPPLVTTPEQMEVGLDLIEEAMKTL
jgi:4-aminobutyrate aminotransferase/(S)-3-amino-2-methylpropionate transaminase